MRRALGGAVGERGRRDDERLLEGYRCVFFLTGSGGGVDADGLRFRFFLRVVCGVGGVAALFYSPVHGLRAKDN